MGRKVEWTKERKEEAIEKIFTLMAEEGRSLRSILDNADRTIFPSNVTFCQWLAEDDILSKQYAHVVAMRADLLFDELLSIADDSSDDVLGEDKHGNKIENKEFVNRSRLRIDTRKWALSKMNAKKYGDKIDLTTNGENISTDSKTAKDIEEIKNRLRNSKI